VEQEILRQLVHHKVIQVEVQDQVLNQHQSLMQVEEVEHQQQEDQVEEYLHQEIQDQQQVEQDLQI
jgi:hypothetical protein